MSHQPSKPDQFDYLDQDPAGDQDGASYIAPDEPMGSHSFGTTTAEERAGETLQYRDKHTNPEVWEEDELVPTDAVGRLVQPGDEDVDAIDDEGASIAIDSHDLTDEAGLSAEEAAMHTTDL